MAGTYTTVTLNDAVEDMGSRLYDPDHVRWSVEELTIYIQQALRTYNAWTNHFRSEASFSCTSPTAFYDLPTVLPSLRAQTYTIGDAVNQLCYHLLEPIPVGGLWVGTAQFSLDDILGALQQARDTFILETGVVQTHSTLSASPFPAYGIVNLPETVINVRRLGWALANGITTVLRRDDQWGLTNYRPGWQTSSTRSPIAYSVSTQPPLQVQLAPISSVGATLDMLSVDRGPTVSQATLGNSLGVPNDWAWVVIFGALGQLLQRDGIAVDAQRATYCQQRWDHGLKMARAAAVVLSARVEGVQVQLGSVADADFYSPSWQAVPAAPKRILTAGHTVVACWPPPGVPTGGGEFEVLLQVVRNAPVPTDLADPLQIGPELTNDLLDYAQHLALVKEGAVQIQESMGLLNQFADLCGTTVDIQLASMPTDEATKGQTVQDERAEAYR